MQVQSVLILYIIRDDFPTFLIRKSALASFLDDLLKILFSITFSFTSTDVLLFIKLIRNQSKTKVTNPDKKKNIVKILFIIIMSLMNKTIKLS